jgi:hypothetical protein
MMTSPVAGIDPHQETYTVGIVDPNGVELGHAVFSTSAAGYVAGIELLSAHGVHVVGIEGSAGWGAHAAIAFVAAGFDCREAPPQRSAAQRRARRLDKTDHVDAVSVARAVLAEPTLGPGQTLEVYDPLVAKIEAVLEHCRMLVSVRTLVLHHVQDHSVTQHRDLDDARTYIERKLAEGKTGREARRAHKRHLADRVTRRMWNDESRRLEQPAHLAA